MENQTKTIGAQMIELIDSYIEQLDKQRAEYTERLRLIRLIEAQQLNHKPITLDIKKGA